MQASFAVSILSGEGAGGIDKLLYIYIHLNVMALEELYSTTGDVLVILRNSSAKQNSLLSTSAR